MNVMNHTHHLLKQRSKRMMVNGKSIEEDMIIWEKISDEEYVKMHGKKNLESSLTKNQEAKLKGKCC